ncbi:MULTISPECIES: ThiF family adenylyltransferase [Romboutsia]|uniref:UBA/THIF-type NAD/FAD binding protein n=1 Tax=Romboutsia hominis TaxID=1507512 RepID=A0A2P2BP01_9FIRM|nr:MULTISPECIES: tRNA threonylcarbamoyladenosine dehydratase [Romboutsia]MCH1959268.1 tRNA threonylcarbamoyladenosine dehydratase [Romboutsia hominis]MCH1970167.1 tRNA threonylcarbamoyladenosine dehydratase [Romboutsia hominis]MDB8790162.1 tRNA threonylcarbamoyladenosine dehydratase [Romboutsia sp. 1001216sp1]MDB8792193.1 tRNA threonylcarbamoyladenosine dehydratase [Romboutsia sp. 1001216sp1]MDB8797160.1 tRNA threonylcarbamoyladenosine dehydratase [Romboutsia sp. 1001216sp1]
MEKNFTTRTGLIIGQEGIEKLKNSNVIVFGVGGVGSFAAEAIARAGVGNLTIVDFDDVDITNINRQLPALHSTVGRDKVDVMKERILDINPDINIKAIKSLYNEETSEELLSEKYDYVVDAIDMVSSKIHLIETCKKKGLEIISSMGMGNKLDPTKIVVTDVHKTTMCPLAKVMRKELRDRKIKKLKVVFSTEKPRELKEKIMNGKKVTPGSVSFVPSVGGLVIASVVINDLINK